MVQPQQQAKKGLGLWGWVAIGCVGIVVLGGIGVGAGMWWIGRKAKAIAEDPGAAIEMALKLNPDIEVVDRDTATGKFTIRDKHTGKTVTVDLEDIKEGRIDFQTSEGNASISFDEQAGKLEIKSEGDNGGTMSIGGGTELPGWVPAYPGATTEGVYSAETAEQSEGTFTATTGDNLDAVFAYYKGQLEGGGYKVTENRYSGSQGNGGILVGESSDGRRTLTFAVAASDGKTQVNGRYSEKKG